MPNDVYTHFFPSLLLHCLLFRSCAFSHSQFYCDSFLYHSLILRICIFWLECGSDSRGNIFLFAESSVLNLSFGWWNFRTTHTHIQIQIQCVGLQFLSKVQFEMHILSHANERWNDDDAAAIVSHHAVAHSHNQTKSATDWMLAGWVRVRVCLRVCACVYVCESTCKCVRCARALIHIHST